MQDAWFDRREAQPRFIVKPVSTTVADGQTATFSCRVIAPHAPIVSWFRDTREIKQSVKYLKKYQDNEYELSIHRVRLDDRGEYVVRAKNAYGSKEEVVFLNVQKSPSREREGQPPPVAKEAERRPVEFKLGPMFVEPDTPPKFTFHLRPRLIQQNHHCKLICTLAGKPVPAVTWYKDGRPVDEDRVLLTKKSGVCTLEIYNTRMEDAGRYSCSAASTLGEDETSCILSVQGRRGMQIEPPPPSASFVPRYRPPRRVYDYALGAENDLMTRSAVDIPRQSSSAAAAANDDAAPSGAYLGLGEDHTGRKTKDDLDTGESGAGEAPSFADPLPDTVVDVGQAAELTCRVVGQPEPWLEWLFNGERLQPGSYDESRISWTCAGGKARLRLDAATSSDAGEYCARATNAAGTDVCKATLTVRDKTPGADVLSDATAPVTVNGSGGAEAPPTDATTPVTVNGSGEAEAPPPAADAGPPVLVKDLESRIVPAGTEVVLECQIAGGGAVQWLRNGKELKADDSAVSIADCRLTLRHPTADDSGLYQCESVAVPAVATVCQLLVVDPKAPAPSVVKLPQSLTVEGGAAAKLLLELADTAGLTVQWFKGTDKVEKSDRIKSVKSGNAFKLDFKTTAAGDTGVYTVKVIKDKKAIAKYSASVTVKAA